MHDIINDEWKSGPSLNEAKQSLSAVILNCKSIYVFSGLKEKPSEIIEYLNVSKDKKNWKIIKIEKESNYIIKQDMGCFALKNNKILIFGGVGKSGSTDDIILFDTSNNGLKQLPQKLSKKEWFVMQSPIKLYDGTMCITNYFYGDIYMYNEESGSWNILKAANWIL